MSQRMLALFVAATMPLTARAQPADQAGSAVFSQQYLNMRVAMDSRDPNQIKALLTPDFVSTDVAGKTQDGAAMIAELIAAPIPSTRERKTVIDSVASHGDLADVGQHYEASWTKTGPDGAQRRYHLLAHSHDQWQRRDHVWRLRVTTTDSMHVEIDYRVVDRVRPGAVTGAVPGRN